ncbi:OmpP1/FadL family transporter [uncultured Azohydromonas sp.]|jgi:Long-chain fatty acid transport protein|uniref:OmpP1/FadL family transporter n=1 Tax=uncultured Azohydromonas sp. TaxID=487342 RepID=UPI00262BDC8D|nr:outer membrane protein transport protein [uncultured Azohydromonas sp.]
MTSIPAATQARVFSLRPRLRTLPAALLGLLGCSLAQAAGFQLLEQNASGLGNAYAGSAAIADNASTVFFNPAGMTELRERELSLGGTLVDLSAKFRDNGSSAGALTGAGNGGDAGARALVPNAYLSWKLGERLWGGLGISAPFGLRTEYDSPWVGGAHAIHFDVKTININPSLAFKVNETLSLGAGLNYQKLRADYLRLISIGPLTLPPPVVPVTTTVPLQQSTVLFKGDDWSWGWNVGALYKPTPDTRLGIAYRSAIKHTVSGSLTTGAPTGAEGIVAAIGNSGAYTRIKLPETLIISAAQRVNPQWEVLGDVSWTGWNSIQDVNLVRSNAVAAPVTPSGQAGGTAQTLEAKFRNSWRVALGANFRWNDAWTFRGGLAYDRTPVRGPATTLVSLPDANRTWLTLGAQWRPTNDDRVDFGLARILIRDADIDNDQGTSALSPIQPPRGRVTGSYESDLWLLGVQYSRAF